jgi:hypothetical protein
VPLGVLVCALACGRSGWAQSVIATEAPRDAPKKPPPLEFAMGAFAEGDFGTICQRNSDVVGCSNSALFAGFTLSPRWRFSPLLSVGVLGAVGWQPSGSSTDAGSDGSHLDPRLMQLRLEAEARWHPLGAGSPDLWLATDAGIIGISETLYEYGPGGILSGSSSATELGPTAGAALGVDFATTQFLSLGFELRAAVRALGHGAPVLDPARGITAHDFGTLGALSLALNGTFLTGR